MDRFCGNFTDFINKLKNEIIRKKNKEDYIENKKENKKENTCLNLIENILFYNNKTNKSYSILISQEEKITYTLIVKIKFPFNDKECVLSLN